MSQVSSGFIVRGKNGKYLLGKVSWAGKVAWSSFKGAQEQGETLLQTAIRELREESGIDINKDHRLNKNISANPIHSYQIGSKKQVVLYLLDDVDGALDGFNFNCDSFWQDKNGNKHPEIMDYAWYDISEMEGILFPSQRGLVYTLKNIFKKG